MKKADVKIHGLYRVKVSGVIVTVRILRENRYGGWDARSEKSGRMIRVRTAQRLREAVEA